MLLIIIYSYFFCDKKATKKTGIWICGFSMTTLMPLFPMAERTD